MKGAAQSLNNSLHELLCDRLSNQLLYTECVCLLI